MLPLREHLSDSFTQYRARIGLATSPEEYFCEHGEIVLNWPYKDCILEGGQEKELSRREEVFYNPIISPTEVNRLLEPKVFTNWQRHNSHGVHELKLLKPNDNLVIKGNNLVVLHSLKVCFAGKVKLIYIDVPFNTGKDIFNYNDNFTHSTWLTFIKNRLEVARELLSEDGTIFLHVDWHECHYLKVLCDEIFGRDNFINEIIWCYTGPSSPKMAQLNRKHDTILWYSKTTDNYTFNKDVIRVPYADPHQSMRKSLTNDTWTEDDEARMRARGRIPDDWWDDIPVTARMKIDGVKRTGYNTEKPYKLLDRILLMASNEGDLVLDFFAGSGTTLYSAARLHRHFIGVEQLRGAYRLMKNRLENVANFVSCELMNDAANFIEQVDQAAAEDMPTLIKMILSSPFLTYRVAPEKIQSAEFQKLSLDEQKLLLKQLVDENMLYVNHADIDDPDYHIDQEDKNHNAAFYS